jgi:hypothetical protein
MPSTIKALQYPGGLFFERRKVVRRVTNYSIRKESLRDMREAGRFNPCLEITFKDRKGNHTQKLSAGYQDEIHAYREGEYTFVLCQNPRLGYIGLEVFKGEEQTGDIFLEHHHVIEVLERDDLAPHTIINRLKDYVYA